MIRTNTIKKGGYEVTYDYIPMTATPEQIAKAKEFAPKYAKKRHELYGKKRAQDDIDNITNQVYTSKIFEFMVYNHIKGTIPDAEISEPSCEIYDKPQFDDDLVIERDGLKVKVHVKSHDIKRMWSNRPLSWAFQKEDRLFKNKRNDIMVMGVYLNETEGHLVTKDYVHKYEEFLAPAKSPKLVSKEFVYYKPEDKIFKLG